MGQSTFKPSIEEELFEDIIKPVVKGLMDKGFKAISYDQLILSFFKDGYEYTLELKAKITKPVRENLKGKAAIDALKNR